MSGSAKPISDYPVHAVPVSRRELRKREVRARITESAIELFGEKGCDDVTVEEVCARADVARKTFYNYYPSKQALIRELSDALLLDETWNLIEMAIESRASTADRLRFVFEQMAENLANFAMLERTLVRQALLDLNADPGTGSEQLRQENAAFLLLLRAGLDNRDVRRDVAPEFLAEMAAGSMNAVILNWLHHADYPVQQRIAQLTDYLIEMVSIRD